MINRYWQYTVVTIVVIAGLSSYGCNDSTVLEPSTVVTTAVTTQVLSDTRGASFSAGQIAMTYQWIEKPKIGHEAQLQLQFMIPSHQQLNLSFHNNRRIDLLQPMDSSYAGTETGLISVLIRFIALEAGKTYLKFVANTSGEKQIRAFAIALPVADLSGTVPVKEKTIKPRINLPSSQSLSQ